MSFIPGTSGNDTLVGGNNDGDHYINGYKGDDLLIGGNGDDWLFGGWGNDILIGGAGADQFEFMFTSHKDVEDEHDVIADFDPNSGDLLVLNISESANINTSFALAQEGNDTVVTVTTEADSFTNVNTITLVGIQISDISADDYQIV